MKLPKLSPGLINSSALAIASALNFVAFAIWTYLLDPAELGLFTLISLTVLMLNAIIFEWLRLSMARLLYDANDPLEIDPAKADAICAVALVLCSCLLLAATGLWAFAMRIRGLDPAWFFAIVAWLVSEMLFALSTTLNRLRLKSWRFFANMTSRALFSLAAGYVLVAWAGLGTAGVVLGIIVAQLACALTGIVSDPVMRRLRPLRVRGVETRLLLGFGGPLILSSGLTYIAASADRFILGGLFGTAEVGQYSVAVDLMQKTVLFGMLAINLTAYPSIVRAFERDGAEAGRRALERNFLLQLAVSLPMTIGVAVLAPGVAGILIGPSFRDSVVDLLPIVGFAALLRGLTTFHLSVALQISKRTRAIVIAPIVSLLIILPLGYLGARSAGLHGMAAAVAVAHAVSFLALTLMVRRGGPVGMFNLSALKIVAAAAVMGAVLYPFRDHAGMVETLGLTAVGAVIYAGLIWTLRPKLVRS